MRCRALLAVPLLALVVASPAAAHAGSSVLSRSPAPLTAPARPSLPKSTAKTATTTSAPQATVAEAPVPVPASEIPPAGRTLSADRVLAIAEALPKMRAVRRKYPGSYGGAYLKGPLHWQVSFFSKKGAKEIGQVIIADASGRVLEQWTGFQVAWTMARGYPGAFGGHVNALYIWLPLCILFVLPFIDWRRPFSLLHLDLLVLLSFSVSLAFFNHAHIYASVPLAYPPLLYLLARMLALMRTPALAARPLRLLIPAPVAGARRRLPARLSHRPQRHRFERDRCRLRRGDRRTADRRRQAALRRLSGGQRTRRHLWPRQLPGLRPVRADLRLEWHLGRPARRPRRRGRLRPARGRAPVPARPSRARADARHRPRLRLGLLSLHAVRAGQQLQRHARRRADPRRAAASPARRPPAVRSRRWPA